MLSKETLARQLTMLLSVVLLTHAAGCSCSKGPRIEAEARVDMRKIRDAIALYKRDNGSFPGQLNMTQDAEADLDALYQALTATNEFGSGYLRGATTPLMDPWGNPYRVWFDGNGDGLVRLPGTEVNDVIAIWSDGPNGTNDFGGADDIAGWCYEPL